MLRDALIKLVDLLCILDYIKDAKTSIKDDFAAYKRVFHTVKEQSADALGEPSSALSQEIQRLQMFLSDPRFPNGRYMFENLRRAVHDARAEQQP